MIGKLIDVTNFNRQQAFEFIATKCTECDIYSFCNSADAKICNDKVDYLLEKIRREEEQKNQKDVASVSHKGTYIEYMYKDE